MKPCLLLLASLSICHAGPATGGWLEKGPRAEYFANESLAGVPAFTRKEPRIDCTWQPAQRPGGSVSPGYADVPADGFSVRWTGRIASRRSGAHGFRVIADDGARVSIRPSGNGAWTALADAFAGSGAQDIPAMHTLTAGAAYDVLCEMREATGPAAARLLWTVPGHAEEVIDPAFEASMNWVYREATFADAMQAGRNAWEGAAMDPDGWPVSDGDFIVSEIFSPYDPEPLEVGTMRLTFRGRANVSVFGNGFVQPGTYAYDAGTNVSSALVTCQDFNANVLNLRFRQSSRTGAALSPGDATTGVTEVKLMRPAAPGAATTLDPRERFHPAIRSAFGDRLTAIRFQRTNDQARTWSGRTHPRWPYQMQGRTLPYVYTGRYTGPLFSTCLMAHEYEITLCNETGCDYYVCVPHLADLTYAEQLARLILHGSDANGIPYASAVADPVNPPLNPNLRVYVEVSNELWNSGSWSAYPPWWDYRELIEDVFDNPAHPDRALLNYDNLPVTTGADGYYTNNWTWVRRYWGLHTARWSNAFRAVFGDAAMPGTATQPRVRPYLGWQYANSNDTARIPLQFMDEVLNNASFTAQPRPVSHLIHSGGGAGYYGSGNGPGLVPGAVPNGSFESPSVVAATAAPGGAGWTFTGDAGIVPAAVRQPAVLTQTPGTLRNDLTAAAGMRFTTGAQPLVVHELGRWRHAGNARGHNMIVVRVSDGRVVTYSQELQLSTGTSGSYVWERCVPVTLEAGTEFAVLSLETAGLDQWAAGDTPVTPDAAVTVLGAVTGSAVNNLWSLTTTHAGAFSAGPVNFRFRSQTPDALNAPDPFAGTQCAWILGVNGVNGAVELPLLIPGSGTTPSAHGLAFRAVQRAKTSVQSFDAQTLRIMVNGVDVSYSGINGQPQPYSPFYPWQRVSYWIGNYFFTNAFTATPGQTVNVRIEGTSTAGDHAAFLDDVQVTSASAIFAGGIPDTGEANGQPQGGAYVQTIRADARWASAFGLQHMTYEHGWSIGGDSGASPVQEAAKYTDPRAAQSMLDALEIFHRAGGNNFTLGTYTTWPAFLENPRVEGTLNAGAWPLTQGLDAAAATLPPAADNGVFIPSVLNAANVSVSGGVPANAVFVPGSWAAWDIVVTEAGPCLLTFASTGSGVRRVTLDEEVVHQGAVGGTVDVMLTCGRHTLKWRHMSGSGSTLANFTVTQPGAPDAPSWVSSADGDARVSLAWTAVPGAGSYIVRWGYDPVAVGTSVEVAGTSATITGLTNGAMHYFTVAARDASGTGLPSAPRAVRPFGNGQTATLAAWDFAGQSGNAVSAAAAFTSVRAAAGTLTRGPAFNVAGWAPANCFLGAANSWAQTLADAQAAGHYVEFTLSPAPGYRLSLTTLRCRPSFQNFTGNAADPRGTGIAWRVGSGAFTSAVPVTGQRSPGFSNAPEFTLSVSSAAELQSITEPVTVRIYWHGMANFEGGALGGPGDDLAVDGSVSLLPVNLPPLDEAPELIAMTSVTPGSLTITLTAPDLAAAPGWSLVLETSHDLVNWQPSSAVPEITPAGGQWNRYGYTLTVQPADTRLFARARLAGQGH